MVEDQGFVVPGCFDDRLVAHVILFCLVLFCLGLVKVAFILFYYFLSVQSRFYVTLYRSLYVMYQLRDHSGVYIFM